MNANQIKKIQRDLLVIRATLPCDCDSCLECHNEDFCHSIMVLYRYLDFVLSDIS